MQSRRTLSLALSVCLVFVLLTAAGCAPSEMNSGERASVAANSPEITLESYSKRKIVIEVPPGNRNKLISWETLYSNETTAGRIQKEFSKWKDDPVGLRQELDRRFRRGILAIHRDPKAVAEIKRAAALYEVDPAAVVGAIAAEHTYNVDITDTVQTYFNVAGRWAKKWGAQHNVGAAVTFEGSATKTVRNPTTGVEEQVENRVQLVDILKQPQMKACDSAKAQSEARYWDCVNYTWNRVYYGKTVDGVTYPKDTIRTVFFNPLGVGLTYGLGQLDPVRALMVNDIVNKKSGFPRLSVADVDAVYEAIINPYTNVHYVAATLRVIIDAYAEDANFDISKCLGVIATLYNMGKERHHARVTFEENVKNLRAGQPLRLPQESTYGFYVNAREADIRAFVERGQLP